MKSISICLLAFSSAVQPFLFGCSGLAITSGKKDSDGGTAGAAGIGGGSSSRSGATRGGANGSLGTSSQGTRSTATITSPQTDGGTHSGSGASSEKGGAQGQGGDTELGSASPQGGTATSTGTATTLVDSRGGGDAGFGGTSGAGNVSSGSNSTSGGQSPSGGSVANGGSSSATGGRNTGGVVTGGQANTGGADTGGRATGGAATGGAATGGACPTGQARCSGSACVDVQSSPSHCGASCTPCSGSTPKCYAGGCVQCVSGSDCSSWASNAVCATDHTCQCRQPSATNILQNPGFDQAYGVGNWSPNSVASYSTEDADSCPASGSALFTVPTPPIAFGTISECVSASPNRAYSFGLAYKQESANCMYCYARFYQGSTCSGDGLADGYFQLSGISAPVTSWMRDSIALTSPAGAGSVTVFCQTNCNGKVWVDQLYLNSGSDSY